jgi:hypothetical protein
MALVRKLGWNGPLAGGALRGAGYAFVTIA